MFTLSQSVLFVPTYIQIASTSSVTFSEGVTTGTLTTVITLVGPERERFVTVMFLSMLLSKSSNSPLAVKKCVRTTSTFLTTRDRRTGAAPGCEITTRSPMSKGRKHCVRRCREEFSGCPPHDHDQGDDDRDGREEEGVDADAADHHEDDEEKEAPQAHHRMVKHLIDTVKRFDRGSQQTLRRREQWHKQKWENNEACISKLGEHVAICAVTQMI
eukprot:6209038-Pleurochrysis_carterae.AAC.2